MSKANAGNIRNGDAEPLHLLTDKVEKMADDVATALEALDTAAPEYTKMRTQLEGQEESIKALRTHCARIDTMLPEGGKLYHPQDGGKPNEKWKEDFGRFVADCRMFREKGHVKWAPEQFQRAQKEGTDADGGFLVPEEQSTNISALFGNYGLARRLCTTVQMNHEEWRQPTLNAHMTMSYPGESVAPSQTKATFLRPAITARKLSAVNSLSIEVDEDSIPGLGAFLVDMIRRDVPKEEDRLIFTGDTGGTDPQDGLLVVAGLAEFTLAAGTTYVSTTYDDLVDLSDSIDEDADDNADEVGFIWSRSIQNVVRKLKDGQDRPLWVEMAAQNPPTALGFRYYRSGIMPKTSVGSQNATTFMLYGNFRQGVYMGLRSGLAIDFDRSNEFKEGNLVLRVLERYGFAVVQPTAVARMITNA